MTPNQPAVPRSPFPVPRIFGIRHHGPGTARALRGELEAWEPDCVLIEGPADASHLLPWLGHELMEPPVALLLYRPDDPRRAGYFPYAEFSPEYQAVRHALARKIPVRLIDLPQGYLLGVDGRVPPPEEAGFRLLAKAAGVDRYEEWWNQAIEQRRDGREMFEGILTLMRELRAAGEAAAPAADEETAAGRRLADQREAHMRREIRQAQGEGFQRIAVVCGAWHAPSLADLDAYPNDDELLGDLPLVPVEMAWVPWTYGRLAAHSGYGAGIRSPGWYDHLWTMAEAGATPAETAGRWLARIGRLLREEGLEASPAHVIEGLRLAEALAALRGRPLPGLPELNEATRAVICEGRDEPMQIIRQRLIVGERMGLVPPEAPLVPFHRDLFAEMKRLRLRPDPEKTTLKLDLRHPLHLERSALLHRLQLLDIPWGQTVKARSAQGTYNEVWRLQWLPDFAVRIITANLWGNTVFDAAAEVARHLAGEARQLPALTRLLDRVILAALDEAVPDILQRIADAGALSSDIPHMMDALPPLARIMRYGSVRQTDQALIARVVETLLTRICIGLPSTCARLNDDAADEMLGHLLNVHGVIGLLESIVHQEQWWETLRGLADQPGLHGLLAGRLTRWLFEAERLTDAETAVRLERALSPARLASIRAEQLQQAAAWLDGFLRGADLLLIHDRTLWQLVDRWVMQLPGEAFEALVPLLRRTFGSLSEATRRQLGERVYAAGAPPVRDTVPAVRLDPAQGARVLETLAGYLVGGEAKEIEP